jgi:hypothetical protein
MNQKALMFLSHGHLLLIFLMFFKRSRFLPGPGASPGLALGADVRFFERKSLGVLALRSFLAIYLKAKPC